MTIDDIARAAADAITVEIEDRRGASEYAKLRQKHPHWSFGSCRTEAFFIIIARHFAPLGERLEGAKAMCRDVIAEYGKTTATAEKQLAEDVLEYLGRAGRGNV